MGVMIKRLWSGRGEYRHAGVFFPIIFIDAEVFPGFLAAVVIGGDWSSCNEISCKHAHVTVNN
jgi:hypothetical protein